MMCLHTDSFNVTNMWKCMQSLQQYHKTYDLHADVSHLYTGVQSNYHKDAKEIKLLCLS